MKEAVDHLVERAYHTNARAVPSWALIQSVSGLYTSVATGGKTSNSVSSATRSETRTGFSPTWSAAHSLTVLP